MGDGDIVFNEIEDDDVAEGLETPKDPRSVTGSTGEYQDNSQTEADTDD